LRKGEDFAARFGGEEFVIVLPSTDLASAYNVAERVRNIIETAGLPPLGRRVPPPTFGATVSCGVACGEPGSHLDPKELLEAADQALYRAKRQGRNCVCYDKEVHSESIDVVIVGDALNIT
jgi:diguanylate cyclase (GGDEF)-like protein